MVAAHRDCPEPDAPPTGDSPVIPTRNRDWYALGFAEGRRHGAEMTLLVEAAIALGAFVVWSWLL